MTHFEKKASFLYIKYHTLLQSPPDPLDEIDTLNCSSLPEMLKLNLTREPCLYHTLPCSVPMTDNALEKALQLQKIKPPPSKILQSQAPV